MRIVDVPTSRSPSLREMRGTTILALAAGVALTLPKRPAQDDDIHVIVKAMGAGCTVRAQTSGLEIGEYATSGSPLALTMVTTAVTLAAGEVREYAWSDTLGGYILVRRSTPPSTVRAGSLEPALVGTGDGAAVNFDLPSANVAQVMVAVAGAVQAPAAYSISAGAGTGGVDRLVMGVAPTSGQAVVVHYLLKTAV